jgi:ketosteroid isomerase-like protein
MSPVKRWSSSTAFPRANTSAQQHFARTGRTFWPNNPDGVRAEVSGWKSESEGNLAYGRFFFSVTGIAKDGNPLNFTLRIIDVYKKINGNWLAIHEHASWPVNLATRMADLSSAP